MRLLVAEDEQDLNRLLQKSAHQGRLHRRRLL